jgi:hypothetical protein
MPVSGTMPLAIARPTNAAPAVNQNSVVLYPGFTVVSAGTAAGVVEAGVVV